MKGRFGARVRIAAFFLSIICGGAFGADAPKSERPSPKRNFLDDLAANSHHPAEKPFFDSLLKAGGHERLLAELGIIQSADNQRWRIGTPDGGSRPATDGDLDWHWADRYRKRLVWNREFSQGSQQRRVLIFDESYHEWPGTQYIAIVLTDSRYRVLSWRTAGGEPILKDAELIQDADYHRLTVSWRARHRGHLEGEYRVTADGIYLYNDPSFDPPHQEISE